MLKQLTGRERELTKVHSSSAARAFVGGDNHVRTLGWLGARKFAREFALEFATAMVAQCSSEWRVAVNGIRPLAVACVFFECNPCRHSRFTLLVIPKRRNRKHQQFVYA